MRVTLIGPPQSGKSTLFAAVAEAGGSHIDLSRPDKSHLAVVKVPDSRLDWLADQYHPKKTTHAELEFLDLPGFDLSSDSGRHRTSTHWAEMSQGDMLVFVLRQFESPTVPAYRNRIDPQADAQELLAEMLFADLERVTARIEKLQASIKKPTPRQEEQTHELELMKRLVEALEAEKPISDAIQSEYEEKLLRSFAFLSLKPVLAVLNCSESEIPHQPEQFANLPCIQLSAEIEEEIAQLPPEDRGDFLADLGVESPARDRLIQGCYKALNLVSFLTMGDDEFRAWTVNPGTEALAAAGEIHTDMARGFIRAETVGFDDFKAAGDMKAAKAAGKVRLEGKNYIVQDGDIIKFRFNV